MDADYYKKRAKWRLVIAAGVLVVGVLFYWYFVRDGLEKIAAIENSAEGFAVQEVAKTISAPPPLIAGTSTTAEKKQLLQKPGGAGGTAGASGGGSGAKGAGGGGAANSAAGSNEFTLTRAGVIAQTNIQRDENGDLPALAENMTLDQIAQLRLNDMFAKQYFAHVSPASSSAETVAAQVGYNYIDLGENLALGNFEGDDGVVTAWMGSPGHRANILNTHYTQIGVAVGEGEFQGYETWIAVQIFGRPASDCPAPDPALQTKINSEEAQLTATESQLQAMQTQMTAMQQDQDPGYNQEVASYNAAAASYDTLVAQAKADVTNYNTEVATYNTCINE